MHSRTVALAVVSFIFGTISIGIAYAWSGPTAAPPNGNVAAPINVGSTDQVKDGGIGVNKLAVFGNSLLGGFTGSNAYLNFGAIPTPSDPSTGYGIRDNAGTLEFKNDSGDWASLQSIIYTLGGAWATSGNNISNSNTGNVGIGTTNPRAKLEVYSTAPYEDQLIVRSNSSETGISLRNDITNVTWQLGMEGNPPSMPIGSFFIQNETNSYTPVIITPGGYVGIWDAAPAYQLDVQGYVRGVFISASDIRLKRDIHPLSGDLEKLLRLQGVSFYWKDTSKGSGRQIGLIAQDVEKEYPELVSTDNNGIKSLNYQNLVAPIIETIKSIYAKIVSQENIVEILQQTVSRQQHEIEALKSIVCEDHPSDPYCNK